MKWEIAESAESQHHLHTAETAHRRIAGTAVSQQAITKNAARNGCARDAGRIGAASAPKWNDD